MGSIMLTHCTNKGQLKWCPLCAALTNGLPWLLGQGFPGMCSNWTGPVWESQTLGQHAPVATAWFVGPRGNRYQGWDRRWLPLPCSASLQWFGHEQPINIPTSCWQTQLKQMAQYYIAVVSICSSAVQVLHLWTLNLKWYCVTAIPLLPHITSLQSSLTTYYATQSYKCYILHHITPPQSHSYHTLCHCGLVLPHITWSPQSPNHLLSHCSHTLPHYIITPRVLFLWRNPISSHAETYTKQSLLLINISPGWYIKWIWHLHQ